MAVIQLPPTVLKIGFPVPFALRDASGHLLVPRGTMVATEAQRLQLIARGIFVDENDHLLLSRKLVFDAATQVNIARVHYEVQTLPSMAMDPVRFSQAAQWHMDNFSLDQIKP